MNESVIRKHLSILSLLMAAVITDQSCYQIFPLNLKDLVDFLPLNQQVNENLVLRWASKAQI